MRGLARLIPNDVRDSLNANPTFQWIVVVLLVVVGVFLALKGIKGFQEKRLTGKRGRVFEGTTAQVLGVVYAVLGALLTIIGLGLKLAG
jgi:ABC-type phosphate transport system permease subunit